MIETVFTILLSSLLGAIIRFSLTYADQRWAATYHFTLTCMLLPPITFVVTKLISGNIALSLGMVGALSIVRFRNPVKSSLELTIYFLLITIGIACSVVSDITNGIYNLLKWDRQESTYYPIKINLYEKGEIDE